MSALYSPEFYTHNQGEIIGELEISEYILTEENISGNNNPIKISSYPKCTIKVYGNEGPVNHFHISAQGMPDICVKISDNMYFTHGSNNGAFPSSRQCKDLDKWLKTIIEYDGEYISNWTRCKISWNKQNPTWTIDTEIQPDYDEIKPYK